MKTTLTVILALAFVLVVIGLFVRVDEMAQADKARFNAWADQCRSAGGGVTIKSIRASSTMYECVGIDDKAMDLPEMEY